MKKLTHYLESWLIFGASLVAFLYGIFGRELIGFETRFGLFAKEMLQNGFSLFPTTYSVPYPDYPGLQTWLIYLASLPFGHLTTFSAILPSAVACSLTLVWLYRLLHRYDRTWALAAVLLAFISFQFLEAARTLSLDSLVMMVAMWAFYQVHGRSLSERYLAWDTVKLWLPLIVGFAIRGPIGLVIPAGIVCLSLWSSQGIKVAWRYGCGALGVLVLLLGLLLWGAYLQGGQAFVHSVMQMQILGRMSDHAYRYRTFAYFTDAFANYALSFELALLTLILFAKAIIKADSPQWQLLRQAVLWVLVVMIGMSIPGVRKIRYILPIVPALLILAGFWWQQTTRSLLKSRVLSWVNYLLLSLPFIGLALITAFIVVTHLKAIDVNAHYFSAYFLLSLLALFSGYILLQHPKAWGLAKPLRVLGLGAASFWVLMVFVINPVEVSLGRVKPFVAQVLNQLPVTNGIAFFQMDPDAEAIQFMLTANLNTLPLFVQTLDGLPAKPLWFIALASTYDRQSPAFKQRVEVVQQGRLGHQAVVVFRLISEVRQ